MAALAIVVATGFAAGACSDGDDQGPQAGVAPGGAASSDAGVTNGAISYTSRDLIAMMAGRPTQADRVNAASRDVQKMAGTPVPAPDQARTARHPRLLRRERQLGPQPAPAQVRRLAARRRGGGGHDLGQYIPVAVPDTTTYPGSDYYEIAVRQYAERLHRDLPATRLRGYVQLNRGTDASGRNTVQPAPIHYLGPLIEARRGRPVRIKFVNELPAGEGGKLSCPWTPRSPARAPVRLAAPRRTRRTGRRCTCRAG